MRGKNYGDRILIYYVHRLLKYDIIHATSSSSVSYMPITFGDITFRGLFAFVFFGVTFICK